MYQKSIGDTAGELWKALGAKGDVTVSALPKLLGKEAALVQQATGWLAREHKVEFDKQGKILIIRLTPSEAAAFKAQNGR